MGLIASVAPRYRWHIHVHRLINGYVLNQPRTGMESMRGNQLSQRNPKPAVVATNKTALAIRKVIAVRVVTLPLGIARPDVLGLSASILTSKILFANIATVLAKTMQRTIPTS